MNAFGGAAISHDTKRDDFHGDQLNVSGLRNR